MEDQIIEKLRKFESKVPSTWREEAEFLRQNDYWLKYSFRIALILYRSMKELNLSNVQVAERLECTEEYVSKILSGKENLTLKTIAKIEDVMGVQILTFQIKPNGEH